MRLKLTLAYDGRPYAGWQIQPGRPTVQETVEAAITSIGGGDGTRLHGSGRTDTGVHALGQVAHFDAPEGARLSEMDWHRALNAMVPPTIRVMQCEQVADGFHARFDATAKIYRYRLWYGEVLPPLEFGLAWHLYGRLNETTLRQAARLFEGRYDFSAFCANRGEENEEGRDKVRTVSRVELFQQGELIEVTFEGEGFLYKMVRMLVGAIVKAARGHVTLEQLAGLLADPTQKKPGWQAPPDGLTLMKVRY